MRLIKYLIYGDKDTFFLLLNPLSVAKRGFDEINRPESKSGVCEWLQCRGLEDSISLPQMNVSACHVKSCTFQNAENTLTFEGFNIRFYETIG